jgi:hypothetical protein
MLPRSLLVIVPICASIVGFGLPVHGQGSSNGKGNSGNQSKPQKSIQWLTSEQDVEQALLDKGTAQIKFQSGVELKNVQVWQTPSLAPLTVDPAQFPEIQKDTIYTVTLTLDISRSYSGRHDSSPGD